MVWCQIIMRLTSCAFFILIVYYLNFILFLFNSRLQALQSMMESAHTESLHIKDEKIKTLELHLEEKENLNATLHRQLDTMQQDYQSYLDKYVYPVLLLCV